MKYFTHIITDSERIRDREGRDYHDLSAARRDVEGAIRRLTADELLAGRPLPLGWKVQISDSADVVQSTIAFAAIVLGEYTGSLNFPAVTHAEVMQAAKEIIAQTSGAKAGISTGLKELRTQLRVLGQINTALRRK